MATSTLPETETRESKPGTKYVYFFGGGKADGNGTMKDVSGRQRRRPGGNDQRRPACSSRLHHRNLACRHSCGNKTPADIHRQKDEALAKLEALQGQKLGDGENPLLVSVRSGAKFSMPGMMDTILNLGMNDTRGSDRPRAATTALCLRQLPALHPDVRQRGDGNSQGKVRARFRRPEEEEESQARYRPDAEDLKAVIADYKKVVQGSTPR